jgi:threonine aldolase
MIALMQRRSFLASPLMAAYPLAAAEPEPRIYAFGDGIPHTPAEYAQLLATLTNNLAADDYSRGGVVEQLETRVAAVLGKEAAVWLPTGTLANHLAGYWCRRKATSSTIAAIAHKP